MGVEEAVDVETVNRELSQMMDCKKPEIPKVNELVGYIQRRMPGDSLEVNVALRNGLIVAEQWLDVMLLEKGLRRDNLEDLYGDQFTKIYGLWKQFNAEDS